LYLHEGLGLTYARPASSSGAKPKRQESFPDTNTEVGDRKDEEAMGEKIPLSRRRMMISFQPLTLVRKSMLRGYRFNFQGEASPPDVFFDGD